MVENYDLVEIIFSLCHERRVTSWRTKNNKALAPKTTHHDENSYSILGNSQKIHISQKMSSIMAMDVCAIPSAKPKLFSSYHPHTISMTNNTTAFLSSSNQHNDSKSIHDALIPHKPSTSYFHHPKSTHQLTN